MLLHAADPELNYVVDLDHQFRCCSFAAAAISLSSIVDAADPAVAADRSTAVAGDCSTAVVAA